MLATVAWAPAAAAGAGVLLVAFLLTGPMVRDLGHRTRQKRDASIAAMQREIDAMSLADIIARAERIAEGDDR
jgi:hypothetical protein